MLRRPSSVVRRCSSVGASCVKSLGCVSVFVVCVYCRTGRSASSVDAVVVSSLIRWHGCACELWMDKLQSFLRTSGTSVVLLSVLAAPRAATT